MYLVLSFTLFSFFFIAQTSVLAEAEKYVAVTVAGREAAAEEVIGVAEEGEDVEEDRMSILFLAWTMTRVMVVVAEMVISSQDVDAVVVDCEFFVLSLSLSLSLHLSPLFFSNTLFLLFSCSSDPYTRPRQSGSSGFSGIKDRLGTRPDGGKNFEFSRGRGRGGGSWRGNDRGRGRGGGGGGGGFANRGQVNDGWNKVTVSVFFFLRDESEWVFLRRNFVLV